MNTSNEWVQILQSSFETVLAGVVEFLPRLIIAVLLVILGWIIAVAIAQIVIQIFKALKIDKGLEKAGVSSLVEKSGFELNSGKFVGTLFKWFVIVVFLVASLNVIGLNQVNEFLSDIVIAYIPRVISAVFILLIAALLGEVLRKLVIGAAKAAEIHAANMLGSITKWSIWVFALLTALYEMRIGATFIQTLFTGFIFALALAIGISFGMGGKDAAASIVDKIKRELKGGE